MVSRSPSLSIPKAHSVASADSDLTASTFRGVRPGTSLLRI